MGGGGGGQGRIYSGGGGGGGGGGGVALRAQVITWQHLNSLPAVLVLLTPLNRQLIDAIVCVHIEVLHSILYVLITIMVGKKKNSKHTSMVMHYKAHVGLQHKEFDFLKKLLLYCTFGAGVCLV